MGMSTTAWDTKTTELKGKIREAINSLELHEEFNIGLWNIYSLGLALACGEVNDKILDVIFGYGNTWELVASSDDDRDYSWDEWAAYKLTVPTYCWEAETGDKKRDLVFYLKFRGYGRSHGESEFDDWCFSEPKTKTVEVWE